MLISRLTDAVLACPFLILAIALAAFLGPSLTNAMIAIGVSATPVFVRLTRGQTLAIKAEDFILAARAIGNPPWRVALVHVLPNVVPALIVQATLAVAAAVIAEASLSFLGLGQQPPAPSWGSMLNTAKNYIDNAPWMAVWPGVSIFVLVLSFNLVGDGLRDATRSAARVTPYDSRRRRTPIASRRRKRALVERCQPWPKQTRPRPRRINSSRRKWISGSPSTVT